jgi:SSS family solute:Na+ symporter
MVSTIILGVGIGVLAQPQLAVRFMTVDSKKSLNRAVFAGGPFILMMAGVAYIVGGLSNVHFFNTVEMISIDVAKGNLDIIMPEYINSAMPELFVIFFMITLLAAAMSTLSSQFHTMGTAIGHDFYREFLMKGNARSTVTVTKLGIIVTIIFSVILAYILPISIIARATAIFFGLCAAAFLPMYIGALFWKRMTKEGAIASLIIGTFSSLFWLAFVHVKEAAPLGICKALFGTDTLLTGTWTVVDPILIAVPLATIAAVSVSLLTNQPSKEHLDTCYGKKF